MKIILIQPPVQDFYDTEVRLQPIGLCYLKAAIKKYLPEIDIVIKDYHSGYGRKTVSIPKELSYLEEYYPVADASPFSGFYQYYHFGESFDAIEEELADMNPDVVGISSLFTPYYREAMEVAHRVKKRLDIPVIMGGSHVSAVPEKVLASPVVDYVIRGAGERPMVELVRYLQGYIDIEDVSNLGYKEGGKQCFNPVRENYLIDQIPLPDLSDFTYERYAFNGKAMTFMITSRGCPHRCSFCSVHTTFGEHYCRRSVDDIFGEIEQRYREGYRVIDFEDDNLTFSKSDFAELCRRLTGRFPQRDVEFLAMNGISYASLDEELLELMFRAGFSHLNLSLVSIDREVLVSARRSHLPDAYRGIVNKAFELGFRIVSYQILGFPGERLETMIGTLAFHARLPVLIGVSPFYMIPNAPIAQGLSLTEDDYMKARLTAMGMDGGVSKREDIYTLFIAARIINFLKGLDISESADLHELLVSSWKHKRTQTGIELLRQLRETGTIYFLTSQGRVANRKFKTDLFSRVLRETETIGCLNGNQIRCSQ